MFNHSHNKQLHYFEVLTKNSIERKKTCFLLIPLKLNYSNKLNFHFSYLGQFYYQEWGIISSNFLQSNPYPISNYLHLYISFTTIPSNNPNFIFYLERNYTGDEFFLFSSFNLNFIHFVFMTLTITHHQTI